MKILDLGRVAYPAALCMQEELVEKRIRNAASDTLLLLEHPPVIVTGRGGGRENILVPSGRLREMGIELAESSRGGNVTYHCPGQLVGYPIVDLAGMGRDLHDYLRRLEEALIRALAVCGIAAERKPGLTGVWGGGRKIASLGIAVRKWVAYHGFALNVSNSLHGFSLIRPCGLPGGTMTSVEEILGCRVDGRDLKCALVRHFEDAVYGNGASC